MADRPLIRHPQSKPEDDRWMLDRWTPVESHVVMGVYREHKDREGRVRETTYRCVCLCGWRSIERSEQIMEPCPVLGALVERSQRMKRAGERVEWKARQ